MMFGDGFGETGSLCGLGIDSLIKVLMSEPGVRAFGRLFGCEKAPHVNGGGDPAEAYAINTLRALIYAARTDRKLGVQEKLSIVGEIQAIGLSQKKPQLAAQFLFEDIDPENIARNLTSSDEALWLYALSRSIIRVSSDAGRGYLGQLAQALRISGREKSRIEQVCDVMRKKATKDLN